MMANHLKSQADFMAFKIAMHSLVEDRHSLTREQMHLLVAAMIEQRFDEVQIAALLCAIAQKEASPDEIAGTVDAIVARNPSISLRLPRTLNIGGTGGDRSGTFNISTIASMIVAACGTPVVKHGNGRVTSDSGSSDLVAALGIDLIQSSQEGRIHDALAACNFAFVSTATFYNFPSILTAVRRSIGICSLFNLAGPLVHPAGVEFQLIGVARPALLRPMAEAAALIGGVTAYIVHGAGGLDEVSCLGETRILSVFDGSIKEFTVRPDDFGVKTWELLALRGGSPQRNASICEAILAGEKGAYRDATIVVASTALVLAGRTGSFREAAEMSSYALDSGRALQTLTRFKEVINENSGQDMRNHNSL